MITTRYIDVAFGGARSAMARALYQYDYGQILRITDLVLPFAYEVHFSDTKTGNSVTMIGNADGVEIPDACLLASGNVYCWFYLHDTESDGETRYEVLIPILSRAKPTNAAPTPVQQDVIDQAIAALDAAVQQTGEDVIAAGASASAAAGSASDAEAWAVGERDGEPVESTDPTYHNNSKYYAGEAASAAQTASQDAQTASDAAIAAGNAKTAAESAQGKAETAQEKAEAAQTAAEDAAAQTALDVIAAADSAEEASGYANTASGYASTASGYAIAAQGHANDASGYASSASGYATNAYNSAQAAAGSAGEASGYASDASGYATAAGNAKTAAQGAQTAAETAQGLAESAQTGAESAQTAAESARDAAIAATEDKAPVILDSASGAIVSIVDGANGMNARSLVASMSPTQDLHGYENPWPAGGGVNKIGILPSGTYKDVTITDNGDGSYTLNGTATGLIQVAFDGFSQLPAGEYYMQVFNPAVGSGRIQPNAGGSAITTAYDFSSANRKGKFSAPNGIDSIALVILSGTTYNNFKISPQIESGGSGTAFAPYSNVCPISGRTGLTACRAGKNLCDPAAKTKSSNTVYEWYAGEGFPAKAGTYTLSTDASSVAVYVKYLDGTDISGGHATETFTLSADARIYFRMYKASDAASVNLMLNLGSTALPYEPYVSASYPVTWQTEAGTVYGGTVDLVSGLLTATWAIVDLGSLNWGYQEVNLRFWTDGIKNSVKKSSGDWSAPFICSAYKAIIWSSTDDHFVTLSNTNGRVFLKDTDYTDTVTFKAAMSGVQLCYELATPQTYQLDPQTVSMLLGANNVWATGDTVSLTYPCDTKLFIMRMLG